MDIALPDTLIVKRLPEQLTEKHLNELFSSFGAIEVRKEKNRGKSLGSSVYVKFPSHEDASYAMNRLHQLKVLNSRLLVEYADFTFVPKLNVKSSKPIIEKTSWSFPPCNESIIQNIGSVLKKDQKFYHEVLLLMNNLNLPPPFEREQNSSHTSEIDEVEMEELYKEETEESELEQDDTPDKEIIPKTSALPKKSKPIKRPKLSKPVTVNTSKATLPTPVSEIFEKTEVNLSKKLEVKINPEPLPVASTSETPSEGFGIFTHSATHHETTTSNNPELNEEEEENLEFITKQKLLAGILSQEERNLLPVFKNYNRGEPSSRLYIKNLNKQVTTEDLKFIYGRYVIWTSEEEQNMFDIRLMTEGRMKGQAFITLPNTARAEKALEETNSFMLHGKPLVVQFARSAASKTVIEPLKT